MTYLSATRFVRRSVATGMSGARLVTTALYELQRTQGRFAFCTMCIGVGQGIAPAMERV